MEGENVCVCVCVCGERRAFGQSEDKSYLTLSIRSGMRLSDTEGEKM